MARIEIRMASPRDRLQELPVRPLTARKLQDLGGKGDDARPLTPSTMSGEGLTARSLASARTLGVSRPTSALSGARSARTPTPRSLWRPSSAVSTGAEKASSPAVEAAAEGPYPGTEAEWNMERRWVQRRQQVITETVMGQQNQQRLRAVLESRARKEEEMSRTAEATRYQCALADRRYVAPLDALEDIEATFEESGKKRSTELLQRPEPPHVDVSQPLSVAQATRFLFEKAKPRALNSRIAHLRRIHAHLIAAEESEEEEPEGLEDRQMLSAYVAQPACRVPDDSDVLAGVCDWWRLHQEADGGAAVLDEMRFEQLQEVEDIKRVFSARSVPVNVRVLERALVMPAHKMNPGHLNGIYLVNTKPDLLSNPFLARKKKKPLKRRGKSAKKGGKSKSPSPKKRGKKK